MLTPSPPSPSFPSSSPFPSSEKTAFSKNNDDPEQKTTEPASGDRELWRKVHDNQLGGDADEIERLLNEQKQKQKEASGDAPIEPGPDWTPGVSIHPLELRFEETASCETRDVVVDASVHIHPHARQADSSRDCERYYEMSSTTFRIPRAL